MLPIETSRATYKRRKATSWGFNENAVDSSSYGPSPDVQPLPHHPSVFRPDPTAAPFIPQPRSERFAPPRTTLADQSFATLQTHHGNSVRVEPAANNDPRRGFGRQSNKAPQSQQQQGKGGNIPSPVYQNAPSLTPSSSQNLPNSPAMSSTMSFDSNPGSDNSNQQRNPPFFFREKYAPLIVKGNFMTLAAKPVLIEEGEWLAHQGMLTFSTQKILAFPMILCFYSLQMDTAR